MEELIPLLNPGFGDINIVRFIINLFLLYIVVRFISYQFRKYYKQLDGINHNSFNWTNYSIAIYIIVCAIQNSLALSLGMIGALSVIRFRTAIKDPSELIFLLFITGISISFAANMEIIAIIIVLFWLPLSYYDNLKENRKKIKVSNSVRIEINKIDYKTKLNLIEKINEKFDNVKPKLVSYSQTEQLTLFYDNIELEQINLLEDELQNISVQYSINYSN